MTGFVQTRPAHLTFSVPGPMPGLNEIIKAKATVKARRGHKVVSAYTNMKATWTNAVGLRARSEVINGDPSGRALVLLTCFEPNKRRDPDNVASGARKMVLDGLVKAGVLKGDGWRDVWPIVIDEVKVDKDQPRVAVEVHWGVSLRIEIGELGEK